MMGEQSALLRQLRKVTEHIRSGDLVGLKREISQYLAWKGIGWPGYRRAGVEADYWATADVEQLRRTSWSSIQCFGPMAVLEMTGGKTGDMAELLASSLQTRHRDGLRGLVLGGGDMVAEHATFINPEYSFAEVDVYDVNEDAFERARAVTAEAGLKANFIVEDVNRVVLPADTYHLVVVFHAYHHFERVYDIAEQINRALVPGGLFYTFDYVGPCRLQYTDSQLSSAQTLLETLPERYRREPSGDIRQQVNSVDPASLSPNEAIRSDQILAALDSTLNVLWQYNWAGLLYPLLEGIAFNFDENEPADRALIDHLFGVDKELCQGGHIEPNFTITIATKK